MRKKVLALLLGLAMLFVLASCSNGGHETKELTSKSDKTQSEPKKKTGPKFDAKAIAENLEITEYTFEDGGISNLALVVKNTSDFALDLSCETTLSNADGLVGAPVDYESALPPTYSTMFLFQSEVPFTDYEYLLTPAPSSSEPITQNISIEYNAVNKKIIVTATNNGDIPTQVVVMHALFFKGDTPVTTMTNGIVKALAPGDTSSCELPSSTAFDSFQLFVNAS